MSPSITTRKLNQIIITKRLNNAPGHRWQHNTFYHQLSPLGPFFLALSHKGQAKRPIFPRQCSTRRCTCGVFGLCNMDSPLFAISIPACHMLPVLSAGWGTGAYCFPGHAYLCILES